MNHAEWKEKKRARYEKMPRATWDGKSLLYSEDAERFYRDMEDAVDDLDENYPAGSTLADMMLIICQPIHPRPLDIDYFAEDLPDDVDDPPPGLLAAIDAFNVAVAGIILSWEPGKYALDLGETRGINGEED